MDASQFDVSAYKAGVLASAGSPVNADVEIDSVDYHVEVQYSFSTSVNENEVARSVSSATSVPESQVSVLSASRRLNMNTGLGTSGVGRRLPTSLEIRVSTSQQEQVQAIVAGAGDHAAVQQGLQAQGVSADVDVAQPPKQKVSVRTRILAGSPKPVSAPDSASLATHLSSHLGTDVSVTVDSVSQQSSASQTVASLLVWGIVFLISSSVQELRDVI